MAKKSFNLDNHSKYDYFIECDGTLFAGRHLILDFYDAQGCTDIELLREAMTAAIKQAGAHLLHMHLHHFSINSGSLIYSTNVCNSPSIA